MNCPWLNKVFWKRKKCTCKVLPILTYIILLWNCDGESSEKRNSHCKARSSKERKKPCPNIILFYIRNTTYMWLVPCDFQINKSHFLLIIPLRHISMELRTYPSIFMHGFGWRIVWSIVKFYFSIEVQLYHFQIWFVVELQERISFHLVCYSVNISVHR